MLPYDRVIEILVEQSGKSKDDIEQNVQKKLEQLSGLISKEGAAHIVANELGIKVIQQTPSGKVEIKNLGTDMKNIELIGKVTNVYDVREFQVGARSGKVGNFVIEDNSGSIRIVAWNSIADELKNLKQNDTVRIESGYTKMNNGQLEVHLNDNSKIIANPDGVKIEIQKRKKISELAENTNAEIFGTVVQMFDPRFYEVCPECNKRIKEDNGKFKCATHGDQVPKFSYIVNFTLDDGSESIRVVCFREMALKALNLDDESMMKLKDDPSGFQKEKYLGLQIIIEGRVKKNAMFDRVEMISSNINLKPDVESEIKKHEMENAS